MITLTKSQLKAFAPCGDQEKLFGKLNEMNAKQAFVAGATIRNLCWVAQKLDLKDLLVRFALKCAQSTAYLNSDPRVQAALDATQAWIDNPCEETAAAAYAAAAATYAAVAAGGAAGAAADAAYAAYAAADASYAAAAYAAYAATAATYAATYAAYAAATYAAAGAANAATYAAYAATYAAAYAAADAAYDATYATYAAAYADAYADAREKEIEKQKQFFIEIFS